MLKNSKLLYLSFVVYLSFDIHSDSFNYNTVNNHGSIGLINMPTARFYDESSFTFSFYGGDPDQKITMSSFPFDWLEASFFYSKNTDLPYCTLEFDPVCNQSYKDKGFNLKLRLKEEGIWPSIAIGINDMAGTGFYSSEYIVGSSINNTDFIWFRLGPTRWIERQFQKSIGNLSKRFYNRPSLNSDLGGDFEPSAYFSGETVSPFFGIAHAITDKYLFKFEYDSTSTPGKVGYKKAEQDFSFGLDFNLTKNLTIGISSERKHNIFKVFLQELSKKSKPRYAYKESQHKESDSKYKKFIRNLNQNGIGVNKILEGLK